MISHVNTNVALMDTNLVIAQLGVVDRVEKIGRLKR